jgi:hypothetical protein
MNEQQEPTVTLELKATHVNAIIAGLEELPHKVSRVIIDEIIRQGQPQLQAQAPEGPLSDKVIN